MTENDNSRGTRKEDGANPGEPIYDRMERNGLEYLKSQNRYVVIGGIYSACCLSILVVNVLLVLLLRFDPAKPFDMKPGPIDVLAPIPGIILSTAFFILKFAYLLGWRRKISLYEGQRKRGLQPSSPDSESVNASERVSLTRLFYNITDHMEKIRKIFVFVNLMLLISFSWFLLFYFLRIIAPHPLPPPPPGTNRFIHSFTIICFPVLNFIMIALFPFYLVYEWNHFNNWRKKSSRLEKLERDVSEELEL